MERDNVALRVLSSPIPDMQCSSINFEQACISVMLVCRIWYGEALYEAEPRDGHQHHGDIWQRELRRNESSLDGEQKPLRHPREPRHSIVSSNTDEFFGEPFSEGGTSYLGKAWASVGFTARASKWSICGA